MEYTGYRTIDCSPDDLAAFYGGDADFTTDMVDNQYLILNNDSGEMVEAYRYTSGSLSKIRNKPITSRFIGKVRPRNPQQCCAVDMLYDSDMTVKMLAGKFGSGKTYLMSCAGVDLIESGRFEKIVYVRNNIEVKNSKPIGHLPGTYNEKLLPFAAPLADHFGGMEGLQMMIGKGTVEIVHLGFIRGRDIKNSIILCSEAENLTKEHVQLLISRVGEGSELWLDGDVKQKDANVFVQNSGMQIAVERLAGHKRFGYVKLIKTERSETAAMADLLD